jgi:glycine hydroxymethyltransferase
MKSILKKQDAAVFKAIQGETQRQAWTLELIASENMVSEAVLEAQGSVLTNKYAEGYPGRRYYGGCEFVDVAESLAIERAKKLFGAEHVNVQPHSGTSANLAVYLSVMNIGDTLMGLSLAHGGHLSHGHPLNFSGKYFKVVGFNVRQDTEQVDYDEAERLALEHKPKVICVGASAYSRIFDWERFRKICDKVGAIYMADIAHYAGLVAAGAYPSPVPYCDFVTTTTHKTLRGPRGGMILCKASFAPVLDKLIFPGAQGGPLMHVIAAKAVAFGEALKPSFKSYQKQVQANARALAKALTERGFRIVSGGTDCHMFLLDLRPKNITGVEAEKLLDHAGITVNKNAIPYDPQKPMVASGIRLGTPAVTTRGLKERDMAKLAQWIQEAIEHREDARQIARIRKEVKTLCLKHPMYSERLRA